MAATAPSVRRRSPGASPRPRPGPSVSPRSRWLVAAGVGVLLIVVYLVYVRHAAAGGVNTSGVPGPDLTGSAAQQPNGGAASIPGNLPDALLTSSDSLGQQVQQTDTTSVESPQAIATASGGATGYGGPVQTVNGTPVTSTVVLGGHGFEQSGPGSDAFVPVPLSEAAPTSAVRRPGSQL